MRRVYGADYHTLVDHYRGYFTGLAVVPGIHVDKLTALDCRRRPGFDQCFYPADFYFVDAAPDDSHPRPVLFLHQCWMLKLVAYFAGDEGQAAASRFVDHQPGELAGQFLSITTHKIVRTDDPGYIDLKKG